MPSLCVLLLLAFGHCLRGWSRSSHFATMGFTSRDTKSSGAGLGLLNHSRQPVTADPSSYQKNEPIFG